MVCEHPGCMMGAALIPHRGQNKPKGVGVISACHSDLLCNNCPVCAYLKEDNDLEDIDGLLEKPEDTNGLSQNSQSGVISDSRPLLYVEHR